jgi:hypothetical protein
VGGLPQGTGSFAGEERPSRQGTKEAPSQCRRTQGDGGCRPETLGSGTQAEGCDGRPNQYRFEEAGKECGDEEINGAGSSGGGKESCVEKDGDEEGSGEGWARKGVQGCDENEEASGQGGGEKDPRQNAGNGGNGGS